MIIDHARGEPATEESQCCKASCVMFKQQTSKDYLIENKQKTTNPTQKKNPERQNLKSWRLR